MIRWFPILGIAFALGGCGGDSTTPIASSDELTGESMFTEVRFIILNDGVLSAVIRSDSAFGDQSARYELMGVDNVFYSEQGAEAGRLTSRRGEYDLSTKLFIARDSVVLITEGPEGERRLESDELYYSVDEDRMWTDSPFTLLEAGRTSRGTSFQTDSKFQVWIVRGLQMEGAVPNDEATRF